MSEVSKWLRRHSGGNSSERMLASPFRLPPINTVYRPTRHPTYRLLRSFQTRSSLDIYTPRRHDPDRTFPVHSDDVVWYIYLYQQLLLLRRNLARFTGADYFFWDGRTFPRAFFLILSSTRR